MKPPAWEPLGSDSKVLKLYKTDLNPDWPRIVILELTSERFSEFEKDVLAFDKKYGLYPDQPILWISQGAKPPVGKGLAVVGESPDWRVALIHRDDSGACFAACPHESK